MGSLQVLKVLHNAHCHIICNANKYQQSHTAACFKEPHHAAKLMEYNKPVALRKS